MMEPRPAPDPMAKVWLALLAGSGLALAAGAFLPWLEFGLFSVSGTDVPGALPQNDGHAVAALGLAIAAASAAAGVISRARIPALLLVCGASAASFGIVAGDVIADWQNQSCGGDTLHERINLICREGVTPGGFTVGGSPTAVLWGLTGISAFSALVAAMLLVRGIFGGRTDQQAREEGALT